MEDVISLDLIKSFFGLKPGLATDKYALHILMELEEQVVTFYKINGQDRKIPNALPNDLVVQVEHDEIFIKRYKRFVEQHNLQAHENIYITLPYVISSVIKNMKNGEMG